MFGPDLQDFHMKLLNDQTDGASSVPHRLSILLAQDGKKLRDAPSSYPSEKRFFVVGKNRKAYQWHHEIRNEIMFSLSLNENVLEVQYKKQLRYSECIDVS